MPPKAALESQATSRLPKPLADQVELLAAVMAPGAVFQGQALLDHVDGALLAIPELAPLDFDLLNRILALRTAAERLAQAIDIPGRAAAPAREEARERALAELAALEAVLAAPYADANIEDEDAAPPH